MTQRHLTPIFNPNAEARAMQSLNAVMVLFQTALRPIGPEDLAELQHSLSRLIDCLFPIDGNAADFAGFAPLPSGHYVHPIKTAEVAALLGRSAGMPRSKLITLATSAALMNVGYLQLKQSLIEEPRNLLDADWQQQIHTHPSHSVAALTASGLSHDAITAIGQHHERWNGSGYPHGARGGDICVEARLLAIADTFVALRSQRPHRPAMPSAQALAVIRDGAGQLFEPSLVDAFVDLVNTYAEKEERKPETSAADARAPEAAAAARRAQEAARQEEEFSRVSRDQDRTPDGQLEISRSREAQPLQRTSVPPPAPVRPAVTVPPSARAASPAVVDVGRTAQRRQPARGSRPARTLFSTDVYLRGATGHWLD
jgi:hypothetical protein